MNLVGRPEAFAAVGLVIRAAGHIAGEASFGPRQRNISRARHDQSKYALQSPRMVAFRKEPPGFAQADRKTSENGPAVN